MIYVWDLKTQKMKKAYKVCETSQHIFEVNSVDVSHSFHILTSACSFTALQTVILKL